MVQQLKHYNKRDTYKLDCESDEIGSYYSKHIEAMTAENLDSKSDVAAELAVRDAQIHFLITSIVESECDDFSYEDVYISLPQFITK